MTELGPSTVLAVFAIFCRIGGCLMLMAGFSSPRVPVQVRLFISFAVALALSPLLLDSVRPAVQNASPASLLYLIGTETFTGSLIGLLGRIFFLALQFMVMAMTSYVGFSALPGVPVDDNEPMPSLVSLVTMSATVLFFVADLHWEVLSVLVGSYATWPVGSVFSVQGGLIQIADRMQETFLLALRMSGPFLVFGIIFNLAIGLINKLTPQIPVYFVSLPFATMSGLILLYFTVGDFLTIYITSLGDWLRAQ